MLITTILNTLPPIFRHFHSAWDSTPAAERTVEKLVLRLIVEETRMGINDMGMNAESALVAKKPSKGNKTGSGSQQTYKEDKIKSSKSKLKCWTCGGPHLRRDCPQNGKDGNSKDKKKENNSGLAMVSTQSSNTSDTTNWNIDSGCTEHIC